MSNLSADSRAGSGSAPVPPASSEADSLLHLDGNPTDAGRHYLVMDEQAAATLQAVEPGSGPAAADAPKWAATLLDALDYLHNFEPPVIHGNIRPESLKRAADGSVKLSAVGVLDGSAASIDPGEFTYSPLEQIWEQLDPASQKVITNSFDDQEEADLLAPLDARSDLYSLAASIYHVITRRKPADALERSIEFLDGNPDPLARADEVDAAIPAVFADALMKALSIKRGDRFASAAEMRKAIGTAEVNPLLKKQQEIAAEQQRAAELEKRLKEAEEQRLLAEKRAAEAERLLKETAPSAPIEAQAASSIAEPANVPAASADFDSILTLDTDGGDATLKYADHSPEPAASPVSPQTAAEEDNYSFSMEEPKGSQTMFVIAGIAGAVLIGAVVAWFAIFSGSNAPAAANAAAQPAVEQPAPTPAEPAPMQAAVEEDSAETATDTADRPVADSSETRPAAAPVRRPSRTEERQAAAATPTPVKPAPEKKKVTVDDLINDTNP